MSEIFYKNVKSKWKLELVKIEQWRLNLEKRRKWDRQI